MYKPLPALHTPPLAGTLRILAGLLLLAGPAIAGWQARSPWIIAVLATVFTFGFVIGRLPSWQLLARSGDIPKLLRALLPTLLIQAVLVALVYLVGAGLAAVFSNDWQLQPFAPPDLWQPFVLGTACGWMGWAAVGIEQRARASFNPMAAVDAVTDAIPVDATDDALPPDEYLPLLDEAITPANLFSGPYHAHMEVDDNGELRIGPNSAGSQAHVDAAEARLGFVLPEQLREIYRVQNGGSVHNLCIPKRADVPPANYKDIHMPFGGYEDLLPTERLQTVWNSFLAFADPEDEYDKPLFSGGTENMLVLAQWYRETLFLDYNLADGTPPGTPRVGWVDFDQPDWQGHVIGWNDFDDFLSKLRRFQEEDY